MHFIIAIAITYISLVFHEFGHYISNKIFKLKVRECCIGSGPVVLKFNFKETDIFLRMFPIGGYVGTDEEELNKINLFQYWIIIISGVFMNLLVCYIAVYMENLGELVGSFRLLAISVGKILSYIILNIYSMEEWIMSLIYNANEILDELSIWKVTFYINGVLFMINLIPIPILDGGQIIIVTLKRMFAILKEVKVRANKVT